MTDWAPRNKYEVAPGLFVGSEISDIDRRKKVLWKEYLNGDASVMSEITKLQYRREELLKPKSMRKRNDRYHRRND